MSSSGHIADMIARFQANRAEIALRKSRRSGHEASGDDMDLNIPRGTPEGNIEFQEKMRLQKIARQKTQMMTMAITLLVLALIFIGIYQFAAQ